MKRILDQISRIPPITGVDSKNSSNPESDGKNPGLDGKNPANPKVDADKIPSEIKAL